MNDFEPADKQEDKAGTFEQSLRRSQALEQDLPQ